MSWAANNPEAYDEVCIDGVTKRVIEELVNYGYGPLSDDDATLVRNTITVLEAETNGPQRSAWSELICWAAQEISDAEADYLTRGVE